MTETPSEMRPGNWQVPECPLLIEYSPAVLDEIRMAAVDAFFSLPRGGAEIGGVLFGRHTGSAVRIEAFRAMECEHAMGPTFVLSDKDKARLQAQLEESAADPALQGLEVVGWYHSHTRSEIFLSDLDLEIYKRYFAKPWQVALVVRPAGMKPTRAGFFFRARDGAVHSEASYHEFVLLPAPAESPSGGNGRHEPTASAAPRRMAQAVTAKLESEIAKIEPVKIEPAKVETVPDGNGTALLPSAMAVLQRMDTTPVRQMPEVQPSIEMRPAEFVPPAFMMPQGQGRSRKGLWATLGLLAALGTGAYFSSSYWMPLFAPKPAYLHLQALDHDGQLRIQWDRAGLSSAEVQGGSLEIVDGASATTIPMDGVRLRAGSFQYVRRTNVVEVHLMVKTAQGPLEEFTSFYGQPRTAASGTPGTPDKGPPDLAAEAERARGDLKKEELRTLELQRSLDQMKQLMRRDEERKRVENQMPAGAPPPAESQSPSRIPAAPPQTANTVNPAPRSNPPAGSAPGTAPATPNAAPQERPQGAAQQIVQQATRPLPPPPDKQPAPAPRTAPPPQTASSQPPVTQPTTRQPATPPPPVAPPPAANKQPSSVQLPASTMPSLSGRWVYSPASKSGSAYPPEAVTLMLVDTNNQVNGTFAGKYKVPKNMKMNPKVNFSFEGTLHPSSSKFTFTAADGSRGQVEIIRLPGKQNAIEVVWYSERDKLTFDDIFFRAP